ncbi:cell wall hydrolase [Candidatus Pacearchaeota archaeon]|nr:cell wall hydrolase [Candidatus Pacearchaeota archaeon]
MKTYRFVIPKIKGNKEESSRREFLATLGGYGSALLFGHAAGAQIRSEYGEELNQSFVGRELDERVKELNLLLYGKQEKEEARKQAERMAAELRYLELNEPGSIELRKGSDQLELARMMYGEGRDVNNKKYGGLVGSTALVRQERSGRDLKEILYAQNQYTCFTENDPNYEFVKDPLHQVSKHPADREAWETMYQMAGVLLKNGPTADVTHYWVYPIVKEPKWVKGIEPEIVFEHTNDPRGRITRFYDLA